MAASLIEQVDATKAFVFIGVDDTGPDSGACCPHCGCEGRYIYSWYEFGQARGAMAGCYKLLTGHLKTSNYQAYLIRLAVKQAKNKPLNGWEKTVIRMQKYQQDNAGDAGKVQWADSKIQQAIIESGKYQAGKFSGR